MQKKHQQKMKSYCWIWWNIYPALIVDSFFEKVIS